jgi:uncharacterized protein
VQSLSGGPVKFKPNLTRRRHQQAVNKMTEAVAIFRYADYRRMRWKNGLGETAEVAISPYGATIESFAWRISIARVDSSGPFSQYNGVDRTLCVLSGNGLRLRNVAASCEVDLLQETPPFSFSGETEISAELIEGTVFDFNVMSSRDRCQHSVRRLGLGPAVPSHEGVSEAFLVASSAGHVVTVNGVPVVLGAFDSCRLGVRWTVDVLALAAPPGSLLLIEFVIMP